MTLIFVDGDEREEYELISDHEFKLYLYFNDQKCMVPSSSMLGKYCKIITFSVDFEIMELARVLYGSDDPEIFLPHVLEEFHPKITNADVELNTGYDPETYQKIFDKKSKFADKMEKEYGIRIY
jgi:hypothetical protein